MKVFVLKAAGIVLLNVCAGLLALAWVDGRYDYKPWETDSVLFTMPSGQEVDLVLLGSSHAQFLSRYRAHHECLERELGRSIVNLGAGTGGGLIPANVYLSLFYEQGNRADTILYFIDPFVFYSRQVNENHKFVYTEPLRLRFLVGLLRNGVGYKRILIYLQSKFTYPWFAKKPEPLEARTDALVAADRCPARMVQRADSLYPDGMDQAAFKRYAETFAAIVETAQRHDARLVCAFFPSLLGHERGAEQVAHLLEDCEKRFGIEFYDFTDAVPDVGLYFDYDHLNLAGVAYFAEHCLEPVLSRRSKAD